MATKTPKKTESKADAARDAETPAEEYTPAPDQPGIVLTGTENYGGKQGFIPAADAEKAGLVVTGKGAAVEDEKKGK